MDKKIILTFIIIGIIFASIYLLIFSTNELGVLVSCNNHKIINIQNVPPPLMNVYQPKICNTNITITSSDEIVICNKYQSIFNSEKGIIECSDLDNYKGSEVKINVIFYNLENINIGEDTQNLIVPK